MTEVSRAPATALPTRRASPALPALAGAAAGGFLLGYGAGGRRPGSRDALLRLVGAGILLGVLARPAAEGVRESGASRRRIRLRLTLDVDRPVSHVFDFCKDFENFPRLTRAIERVTDSQDGRSHWAARSPSGRLIEWDAVVTKYVPNVVIGWRSVAGAPVDSGGLIRFTPLAGDRTRLDIELDYRPRATAFGDAIQALARRSRETRLAADLADAARTIAAWRPPPREELPEDAPVTTG